MTPVTNTSDIDPMSTPVEADFVLSDFRFDSGETMADLRLHFRTLGKPNYAAAGSVSNAVLILHGTGGDGSRFLEEQFAGELFREGQPLDSNRYYIVIPDSIGHGQSAKPSDALGTHFPRYGYLDMIRAQHRLLTERLGVGRLRLVMGTSMGGMHTWLWGERYPRMMSALMPLASLPTQISGRNRMWRRTITTMIRSDPGWQGGNYKSQPPSLRTAVAMGFLLSCNPIIRQQQGPTQTMADEFLEKAIAATIDQIDANDLLYAYESSHDYDPGPGLGSIEAPLLAVNFADDLVNPPELGILERYITQVKRGTAVVVPAGDDTVGHQTHTKASVWKPHLRRLLAESEDR